MTETQRALALPNSAVLNMAPGANLPAYVQAVSGIAILSVERERELAERLYYEECVDSARELVLAHLWRHICVRWSPNGTMEQPLGVLVAGHSAPKKFQLFLLLLGTLFAPRFHFFQTERRR